MTARTLRIALFFGATCTLIGLASCSEDGVTANCPPLPLYQTFALGDASPPDAGSPDSPATKAAIAKAAAAGCITLPTASVVATSGGEAGTGGSAAMGGSAGKGGGGGSAGHAGGTGGSVSSENAGAAGSN